MSNFKIKVHVEIVECNEKNGEAPEQQGDGSFTMITKGNPDDSILTGTMLERRNEIYNQYPF